MWLKYFVTSCFPYPFLSDTAGELHHTQKAALGHILEKGVAVETWPASEENICTIFDGQAIVQAKTFGDLAQIFSSTCLSLYTRRCRIR